MTPYLDDGDVRLYHGDCVEVMAAMDAESVDAVVTDPPYGLGFMGKAWDADFTPADMPMRRHGAQDALNAGAARQGGRQRAGLGYQRRMARDSRAFQEWCEVWARAALRVLKPGGHLLAFGGTRTFHRLTCAIEDAGFEIRDCLMWLYGSGFPKSLDVSKAIDKAAGAERVEFPDPRWAERYPNVPGGNLAPTSIGLASDGTSSLRQEMCMTSDPATPEAVQWQGWGTALKPAWEPCIVARKPLTGTVAANVLEHGTGALNIDGCRIPFQSDDDQAAAAAVAAAMRASGDQNAGRTVFGRFENGPESIAPYLARMDGGRWPANVALDEEAAAMLDEQVGESISRIGMPRGAASGEGWGMTHTGAEYDDRGGPSRFYYTSKASSAERDGSKHPTVKPLALMRWLVRLVTPPGGLVLDPFAGSGTTLLAARNEGFRAIGIEREEEYARDIAHRLRQLSLLGGVA